MPSLRETLRGHVREGHEVQLALPKFNIWGDHAKVIAVREDEGYAVHLVPCNWAPLLAALRRQARRLGGGEALPYPLRWILNLLVCTCLTVSLTLTAWRLRRRDGRRFDLVYAHNQYASIAGWIVGRLFKVPNVTRLYGTFLADLMNRPLVWLRYPVAAAGYLVPHSLLICANDGTRGDQVAEKLGIDLNKFRFWQNGVDLPGQPPHISRDQLIARSGGLGLRGGSKWIVSCSRLSYWKRIDRMLHALKFARAGICDCQLLVVGEGPERERLMQLASELEVAEDVVWFGAVQHDQIWELLHVADIFMITNDVTNRCNPLFEAICAGLPVISVRDPSTGDLLEEGDNALLTDKEDLFGLGENLRRLCSDEELLSRMVSAQRPRASMFWPWSARMAVEVRELEELVRSDRGARPA
ncbi:MAG: glycosyltransferase family 4 protein [Deferrisomatales bacterium]|nr:glycosyltransferase family 4 protein [Deferrisomatales bacterium]